MPALWPVRRLCTRAEFGCRAAVVSDTVGERCLIGANAGIGISLGDDCIVEAGCYVTAGARILLEDGRVLKAKELSGQKGLLFRRNSQSGALEATRRTPNWDGLNSQLHS